MIWKRIDIHDAPLFNDIKVLNRLRSADATFIDLYIWKELRECFYTIVDSFLFIKINANYSSFLLYPLLTLPINLNSSSDRKKQAILKVLRSLKLDFNIPIFHSLTAEEVKELNYLFPNYFNIKLNRNNSDYVYLSKELINLNGRKFHHKKNSLNRFLRSYPNFIYEAIDENNANKIIPEIIDKYHQWLSQKEKNTEPLNEFLKAEFMGVKDLFSHLSSLKLFNIKCAVIRVEDNIVAFTLGEILSNEYALIHVEKADLSYEGSFQIINREFVRNELNDIIYINREEDLGDEGLRRAKLMYNPVFFIDKYDVFFNKYNNIQ